MFLRFPQTVPKPAPEPATLTVAAPVSMNLTTMLMPLEMVLPTWKLWLRDELMSEDMGLSEC